MPSQVSALENVCSYNTYQWNVNLRKSIGHQRVVKPYSELTAAEIDQVTSCSICEEDQRIIDVPPLKPFKLCHVIASKVNDILQSLILANEPLVMAIGYRVGKTRGIVDSEGNRTQYSHHSYGVAFDLNSEFNGLYDNCIEFNEQCRLIKGGEWRSDQPESFTTNSPTVKAFGANGFKWGGEILGKQKDFMHFSPTGF